jgi:putative ABC transport system permease protein
MNRWLEGFAYHINISVWLLVATTLLTLSVSFVTVGIQALRAGLANPAKNLKTE